MFHANEMRWTSKAPDTQKCSIAITDQWEKELSEMPYLSQRSGKTIHLLKQSSKPAAGGKKRRKVALLGSLEQFKESKKKPLSQPVGGGPTLQPPVINMPLNQGSSLAKGNVPPMFATNPTGQKGKGKADHAMNDGK